MKHRFAVPAVLILCMLLLGTGVQASAEEDLVYGMMNIPYGDFYAGEGIAATEVDAVTTATTSKWTGGMTTGSYNSGTGEGSYGAILGIQYPVAIRSGDIQTLNEQLDTLRAAAGENIMIYDGEGYNAELTDAMSYTFTELAEKPAAYKTVSFDDQGHIAFSKVNGPVYKIDSARYAQDLSANSGCETQYGDYQLNFNAGNNNNFPVSGSGMAGVNNQTEEETGIALTDGSQAVFQIKGVMILTDGANSGGADTLYALRQMENIWFGSRTGLELAWSAGVTKTVHGASVMDAVHYAPTMGETIRQIIFISDDGYYTLDWEVFLKYVLSEEEYTLAVSDSSAGSGVAPVTLEGLPEDFVSEFSAGGLQISVDGDAMTYEDAAPGEYTLTVSDSSGKYAPVNTRFMLTTEEMPAAYDKDSGSLVPAEGSTEEQLWAYLDAIQSVTVNGQEYNARGHGSVAVILSDGTVDTACGAFGAPGEYEITVSAAGYLTSLIFTMTVE